MKTTKEHSEMVSKEEYDKMLDFGTAFEMREYIKHTLVPREKWADWYGARLQKISGKCYVIHTIKR